MLEWVDPPYSPGHWVPEQIEAAGLVCAYGTPGCHSEPMSMDMIAACNADAVGVICCGFGLRANIEFAEQVATRLRRELGFAGGVVAFDANRYFSRPTFSVVDGAELLHKAFVRGEAVEGASAFVQR